VTPHDLRAPRAGHDFYVEQGHVYPDACPF
jgi:hypothetical protein